MDEDFDEAGEMRSQAAEWFARLKTVPVSRETLEQFFAWRREPGHGEAFDAIERLWSDAGQAGDSEAIRAATDAAYARGVRPRRWLGRRSIWTVAIATMLVAALASVLLLTRPDKDRRYATQVGERSVVTLEDGSTVTLDTASALAVRFTAGERHIVLQRGQAFFAVAHNVARPFTVEADGTTVLATGTQFAVRRVAGATEVTLVEGSVRVDGPGAAPSTILRPGERARVDDHRDDPIVSRVDPGVATAWKRGQVVLDGMTLAQAVDEINRYTTRPVRLESTRSANKRLSGALEEGDVQSFVSATEALLPVRAVRADNGTITLVDLDQPAKE